jgi:hypothetical protein
MMTDETQADSMSEFLRRTERLGQFRRQEAETLGLTSRFD